MLYNSIYDIDCANTMKLQDLHPYDSAIVGLNNIYLVKYNGDFYINSPCIMATDKTIRTGKTYVLVDNYKETGVRITEVKLIDVYYDDGVINLIIQDIIAHKIFIRSQYFKCPQIHCNWILIDLDFFINEMNAKIIQSYCGKCTNMKNKSVVDSYLKRPINDLLEFDF
jgi:hypothetical protein